MADSTPGHIENDDPGQSVRTRLNQIPADAGTAGSAGALGGPKNLASSPAEKKAAAKAIEDHVEPDTRKAGEWAESETNDAIKEFRNGWLTSGALKKAHEAWTQQVNNLMNRLASEKAALRSANTVLHGADIETGANARSVSVIDAY
ncbi:hypothetical protein [Streptomyces sp. NPDC058855]|uniref:hypothetical protein n=1 Tax=Streptomyces sp. NPDC058855 TaxID=3346651 RepID=UPI0036BE9716